MAHKCLGNYIDEKNCGKCIDLKKCQEVGDEKKFAELEKKIGGETSKKKGRPTKKMAEKEAPEGSVVDEAEAMAKEALGE